MGLVKQLFSIFHNESVQNKAGVLRNKNPVDLQKTDLELFESYPLGDVWDDASMTTVY